MKEEVKLHILLGGGFFCRETWPSGTGTKARSGENFPDFN
jgi:hypothetical protein